MLEILRQISMRSEWMGPHLKVAGLLVACPLLDPDAVAALLHLIP
jgi:hypothetical protein